MEGSRAAWNVPLIRAANSAAVGMRNAKLFDEVNYVKHYLEKNN